MAALPASTFSHHLFKSCACANAASIWTGLGDICPAGVVAWTVPVELEAATLLITLFFNGEMNPKMRTVDQAKFAGLPGQTIAESFCKSPEKAVMIFRNLQLRQNAKVPATIVI